MQKYRIELIIDEKPSWARKRFAKQLKITESAITLTFQRLKAGYSTMEKYTKGFNKLFNEKYKKEYLFEKIKSWDEK